MTTLRLTIAVLLLAAASTGAHAYSGCDRYEFGSQDWWFCMSNRGGER